MPNTQMQGLPYPTPENTPNVPADIRILAEAVEKKLVQSYASQAAMLAANPAPADGQICFITNENAFYMRVAGVWKVLWNDSGWVNCAYLPGYSAGTPGQLQVRRIGNIVWIRGGATGSIVHSVYTPVADIPEGYRPNTIIRTGGAGSSGRNSLIEITSEGSFRIAWNNMGTSSSAPSWGAVFSSYPVD